MSLRVEYVLRETAANLWRNRLMTFAAIMTVAVSLSLVGAALLLRQGVNRAAGLWKGNVGVIVFMQPGSTAGETAAVKAQLTSDPSVRSFTYVDQAKSYAEFRQMFSSQKDLVALVRPSDLPPSFRVKLANANEATAVGSEFSDQPGVRQVSYDQSGVQSMLKVTGVVQDIIVGLAAILLLSAAVLILNTIRMAIYGRRREVAVMKLVGATNWFIRVPFMLEGLAQGVLGAAVAAIALFAIRATVQSLISHFQVSLLSPVVVSAQQALVTQLFVVLMGAGVGMVGSAFAVRRFLDV